MKKIIFLTTLLLAHPALAQDYRIQSSTYVRGAPGPGYPDASRHYPLYEFFSVQTRDMGVEGLSVDASMWGRIETMGDRTGFGSLVTRRNNNR